MDLLPKKSAEFQSQKYWETFFRRRGEKAFEWYGEYPQLCGILHKFLKPADKTLVVGCGNSDLSANLYDVGCENIVNIDISKTVISQMTKKHEARAKMKFLQMDVTKMDFETGSFSVVLDKGTLDALMPDDAPDTQDLIEAMFAEVGRVLKTYGRYICITLSQKHILDKALDYFSERGWVSKLYQVPEQKDDDGSGDFHLPVFVYAFVKFPPQLNIEKKFDLFDDEERLAKFSTIEDLKVAVKELQNMNIVRHQIKRNTSHLDQHISLELYDTDHPTPKYYLYIIDAPPDSPCQQGKEAGVFVVPKGRENEHIFGTHMGRENLRRSSEKHRLIVVHLSHDHYYPDFDLVKFDLNARVMQLLEYPGSQDKFDVPYLSIGTTLEAYTVRHRGKSEVTGDFMVVDVEAEAHQIFRRLIFNSNPKMSQSESRCVRDFKKTKTGKRSKGKIIDHSHMLNQYQHTMMAGLALLEAKYLDSSCDVLMIGLGGGSMAQFLHKHFPQFNLETVEIDPVIVDIAKEWFDVSDDNTFHTICADGVDYIDKLCRKGEKRMAVIIDTNNKDISGGIQGPCLRFLEPDVLAKTMQILEPDGVVIINLMTEVQTVREEILSSVSSCVPNLYYCSLENEYNTIMYARHVENPTPEPLWGSPKKSEERQERLKGICDHILCNGHGKGRYILRRTLFRYWRFIAKQEKDVH